MTGMPDRVNDAGTPCSVTVFPVFAEPTAIVYVPVEVASEEPVPLAFAYVEKVKLSEPGGTDGPATAHGLHGTEMADVTDITSPTGGKPPLTVFRVIVTERAFAPTYFGARFADEDFTLGKPTKNDVGTSGATTAFVAAGGVPVAGALPMPPLHAANAMTAARAKI